MAPYDADAAGDPGGVRAPQLRLAFDADELIVDHFAGGGGASTGIERALGRAIDIAINHSPAAIAMHQANHPSTEHYLCNIWEVEPKKACKGRRIGLLWASPDCKHHSRAKGGKPRDRRTRVLANVITRWAHDVRPRVIMLENVQEFEDWGPLLASGQPDPARAGRSFRAFVRTLERYGYVVEWRVLNAADFGAPTSRRRLFLVARCDGAAIRWPAATHGPGRDAPWRTAAEVIDWTLECPSIFGRRRPLAPATLARIGAGFVRFVANAAEPFIVPLTHHGDLRVHGLGEPVRTVTGAHRGELALVSPFIAAVTHTRDGAGRVHDPQQPLRTITTAKGGEFVLAAPVLVQTGYGERKGQRPRALDLGKPLGTVVGCGQKHALVAAFVSKHYKKVVGHGVRRPIGTITGIDHHALTTARLEPTTAAAATSAAWVTKFYGSAQAGVDARTPLPTVTAGGRKGGGHLAAVRAFLVRHAGAAGADGRRGLVVIGGEVYRVVDIGMRMLQPHELFRAQSFPDGYVIRPALGGKPITKTQQVELAGNSVCCVVAAALVAANFGGAGAPLEAVA